ncbi:restriction endonuclease subunit S [Nostoc sp. UHCC 0252]|uniref:restriction endonuclease subunit S n=1 Tax=Nostoc sp. UHCC 0252 TaxID=3110241 RepID=UPI002B215A7D|nr:restriction endonuclease subunit S [Nostoc sp. UHCC 0252]MEA5606006.1 restriction endonuclease subunit S [Nostoc sp. UHCC 0252]
MEDDELYTLVTAKRSRGGIVEREKLKGRDIAVKSQFYIREDDFLISKRQIVHGACGFVPKQLDGAIVSNEYLVINFTDKIIPEFWNFLSYTVYFQQICFHSSIGVHIEKMLFKVEQWYCWKINIPSLEEQEKIASFLGAVDRRLTQLRRKQELLQTYKRGVMQKIFSQEIRFKGAIASPFPDWERKKLKEISLISSGVTPLRSNDVYFKDGSIPWVKTTDLNNSEIWETEELISDIALKETSAKKNPVNSILIAMYGGFNQIGRTGILKIEAATNQAISVVQVKNNLDPQYLLFFLNSNVKKWRKYAGSSRKDPNITSKDVGDFLVYFPSKKEQEKIANFLTAIDRKIETLSRQIEQTEKFKKGLLQKLFI